MFAGHECGLNVLQEDGLHANVRDHTNKIRMNLPLHGYGRRVRRAATK